ncbi:MAG: hypothetical protein OXK21_08990 [Chloroflexota bacterium]|nr:hypothetical protein [Chloroflexota bacterium]
MIQMAAIKLLLKIVAPILAKEIAKLGKKAVDKIWAEACKRVESGEAQEHVAGLRLVLKEWAQFLKQGSDECLAAKAV